MSSSNIQIQPPKIILFFSEPIYENETPPSKARPEGTYINVLSKRSTLCY
jgi:hypothetical protein